MSQKQIGFMHVNFMTHESGSQIGLFNEKPRGQNLLALSLCDTFVILSLFI
jgi:hypothetical protein